MARQNDPIKIERYRNYDIRILEDENPLSPNEWGNDDCFIIYDHRQFCVERKDFDVQSVYEAFKAGEDYDNYKLFPLFAHIHSGVSLSLVRGTDRWDTSFKGFVLVLNTLEEPERRAQGIVETWNEYLDGEVYGFKTDFDSCWGFYGNDGITDAIEEAKYSIDAEIEKQTKIRVKQLKHWIKSKVPIIYREPFSIVC